jgi:hypothetical protein
LRDTPEAAGITEHWQKEASMKAVLKNGVICPQEPLPKDWADGTELQVEKSSPEKRESDQALDCWMANVQAFAADIHPEDEIILEKTIRELRQQARDLARKED